MIFVAVGTQAPFDRMVRAVDDWAARNDRHDVFAQIGKGGWRPSRLAWVESLTAREFGERVAGAEVVVCHAGMGTILTAVELGKPLLIMPRRAALREHRNDHQVDTASRIGEMGLATVAKDEHELREQLQHLDRLRAGSPVRAGQQERLLATLRRFIEAAPSGRHGGRAASTREHE